MKDTYEQNATSQWRPSPKGLRVPMTGALLDFVLSGTTTATKLYGEADTPEQLLDALSESGWIQTGPDAYGDKRHVALILPNGDELRLMVAFDTKGNLGFELRVWYKTP